MGEYRIKIAYKANERWWLVAAISYRNNSTAVQ